jgi:predicted DNA-binding transcriptional regulator YafY
MSLDRVRFAAVNRLCVELEYQKESGERETYLIEPYSLRATSQGDILLYGVKLPSGEIRSFRTDRILGVRSSEIAFTPRYQVEFIPEGPVNLTIQPSRVQITPVRTLRSASSTNYIFECSICEKHFSRKKYDNKLNSHKDKYGYPCGGRFGILL